MTRSRDGSKAARADEAAAGLARRYGRALKITDILFAAFMSVMAIVALASWRRGQSSPRDVVGIMFFLVGNLALGRVSRRIKRLWLIECVRMGVGGVLAATAFLLVSGPLAPWWPGLLLLSLGASIGFGLITQRPRWGRVAVLYYLAIYVFLTALRPAGVSWQSFVVHVSVIALVGFTFAQIMALLGETLHHEYQRGLELRAARTALSAEVEVALEVQKQEYERSLQLRAARDALFAELEVAQKIQTLLLPRTPGLPGCEVVGKMVSASEVGGDYYDVLECKGRRFLAIGDVSGHGLTSGLAMMMASTTLTGALEAAPRATLSELYQVLNSCVRRNVARMGLNIYMTFVLLEYLGEGQFEAVGRHVPFLVYRRASASVETIELSGMWLGVVDEIGADELKPASIQLDAGDQLFLYTDGIVEQFAGGEMFGFERLQAIVARQGLESPERLVEAVLEDWRAFSATQDDDLTMLVVRRSAAAEDDYGRTATMTSNGPDTTLASVKPMALSVVK